MAALELLGYRVSHWEHHAEIMTEIRHGEYRLSLMDRCDAVADLPIPSIYRQLDTAFPGSRFILTTRAPNEWIASVEKHVGTRALFEEERLFYQTNVFDAEVFVERFQAHNRDAIEYFGDRPDLLVMDVTAGDGWSQLLPFLDEDDPHVPFPHERAIDPTPEELAAYEKVAMLTRDLTQARADLAAARITETDLTGRLHEAEMALHAEIERAAAAHREDVIHRMQLERQMLVQQRELDLLRQSRLFRYTKGLRTVYAEVRRHLGLKR